MSKRLDKVEEVAVIEKKEIDIEAKPVVEKKVDIFTTEETHRAHYCKGCDRYVRTQALFEEHIKTCK